MQTQASQDHHTMQFSTRSHTIVARPSSPPRLPHELVSQILDELWDAPHSEDERISLTQTLCLVNRTWLCLFLRIALRNVHLPYALSPELFLRLLPERTLNPEECNPFTIEASKLANTICRSITFHVDGRSVPEDDMDPSPAEIRVYSDTDPAANAVSTVLYMTTALQHLPNLQQISLQYTDWGYENVFEQLAAPYFPSQVTHLSIEFSFTAPALIPLSLYLKSMYSRHPNPRITLPNIRHLSVSGVPMEFVADMLKVCPNVETLEIMRPARLYALVPLPLSVHTLVLRHPGVALDQEVMHWWTLEAALEGGLLPSGGKARIVVQSSSPDPLAFTEMKRICKRYGAELSYERDDDYLAI
ncbi:hypothetical protein C8Q76DRAFT_718047 [Earliella scabrosa]|nr:hypothetical protein C8Q76DRAFT_718047 [Earliella scabrosa]